MKVAASTPKSAAIIETPVPAASENPVSSSDFREGSEGMGGFGNELQAAVEGTVFSLE